MEQTSEVIKQKIKLMKFFNLNKKTDSSQTMQISAEMINGRAKGLMALWVAERMDKTSEVAANYADKMVESSISDEVFIETILNHLTESGQHLDAEELHERFDGFKVIAKLEFEDEDKMGGCS
jgi:hypothetical protein